MPISRAYQASTATAEELRQLCEPSGLVDTMPIITDRDTGRCKGSGCIEMPDSHVTHAALVGLRGQAFAGGTLIVHEATGRAPHRVPRQARGEPIASPLPTLTLGMRTTWAGGAVASTSQQRPAWRGWSVLPEASVP